MKNKKILSLLITISIPLISISGRAENSTIAKNPFKKVTKKPIVKTPGLIGSWQSKKEKGMFTLVFMSSSQLEFNGEVANYKLVPGAIRIEDEEGSDDYKYLLKGNSLLLKFPEGMEIEFERIGQESNSVNEPVQNVKKQPANKTAKARRNSCNTVVVPAEVSGGCNITLITPAHCEEIDLSNGRSYEFAWQTGGSFCETPYKFYISGNPYSESNVLSWSFSTETGKISRTQGGYHYITAADLAELSSDDGTYHWVVMGFYGSHPASQAFRIKK